MDTCYDRYCKCMYYPSQDKKQQIVQKTVRNKMVLYLLGWLICLVHFDLLSPPVVTRRED